MDTEMDFWGYTYTAHTVTTEDDYELVMFRITGDASGAFTPDKPAVVIVHGSSMDGPSWLSTIGNDRSAKPWMLMLADAGYDVFLCSNRGTEYSQNHVTLSAADDASAYWDYSVSEMGLYDDKAFI
jgi:pimeloyl-ACP methyl ester carboxylesterase